MITAFFIAEESNPDELYDYCGCLWPEGMVDSETHFLFNKEKIEKIHHIGFSNDEEKKFKENLYNTIEEIINEDMDEDSNAERLDSNNEFVKSNETVEININQTSQPVFNTLNLNDINNNQ